MESTCKRNNTYSVRYAGSLGTTTEPSTLKDEINHSQWVELKYNAIIALWIIFRSNCS